MSVFPLSAPHEDKDICFHYAGIEQCTSGQSCKTVRDQYVFYFVFSGRGIIRYGYTSYVLTCGNGFFFFPGDIIDYRADIEAPWQYAWLGFSGKTVDRLLSMIGITREQPLYRSREPENTCTNLRRCIDLLSHTRSEIERLSQLYGLFSVLERHRAMDTHESTDIVQPLDYVDAVYKFIRSSYARKDCSIESMADKLGLTRTYLSALIRRRTGTTPKALLTAYRMEQAKLLLTRTILPISDIAEAVGYADPLCFSRAFRKFAGISPTTCRQRNYRGPRKT